MEENRELKMEVVDSTNDIVEVSFDQPKVNKTKSKKWFLGLVLVSCLVFGVVYAYYMTYGTKAMIQANTDAITVELGEIVDFNKNNFVKKEDIAFVKNNLNKTQEDIFEKINIDISDLEYVKDSYYLAIGEHIVKLTTINSEEDLTITFGNNQSEQEIKIIVKDTTKPEFIDFKESVVTYKDIPLSLNKLYTANDFDTVTITVDETNVDYAKVGNYKATVSAADPSGNMESKEVSVIVKSPTITLNKNSATIYINNTINLDATINGKSKTATYSSSNTAIATVDSNGKVKGLQEGTVTITASANGVSDTCKITVKKYVAPKVNYVVNLGNYTGMTSKDRAFINECISYLGTSQGTITITGRDVDNLVIVAYALKNYYGSGGITVYTGAGLPGTHAKINTNHAKYTSDMTYFVNKNKKILNGDMSQKEKANAIYDWLNKNISYSSSIDKGQTLHAAASGKAVCAGQSAAFQFMCHSAGLNAGICTNSKHSWNWVKINGTTYYYDLTNGYRGVTKNPHKTAKLK